MALSRVTVRGTLVEADGVTPYRRGRVTARLSQAGTALDGDTRVIVSGGDSDVLSETGEVTLVLVPNDAVSPSGTVYLVTFQLQDRLGHWTMEAQRWTVPSSAEPIGLDAIVQVSTPTARFVAGPPGQRGPPGASGLAGIWIGNSPPENPVTHEAWLATGTGYWAWLDTSGAIVTLVPPVADFSLTGIAPLLTLGIGQVFAADAAELAHISVLNGTVRDSKGNSWTEVGSIPRVAATAHLPEGLGPFSAANYLSAGNILNERGSFTLLALVSTASHATEQVVIAKDPIIYSTGRNYTLENAGGAYGAQGAVFRTDAVYGLVKTSGAAADAPHFMALSYQSVSDGASIEIVALDSIQASISNAPSPLQVSTANLLIGRNDYATNPSPWLGHIHEIQMLSRALSPEEIAAIYTRLHAAGVV